jgi:hypothetical protein
VCSHLSHGLAWALVLGSRANSNQRIGDRCNEEYALRDTPHKTRYTPIPHVSDATTRHVPHVILRRYAIFAEQMG